MSVQNEAEKVRAFLNEYVWGEKDDDAKTRIIDCIMSQDAWRYIDALADKFAGAQNEPGPEAYSEGTMFALTALYECHSAPHLDTCPNYKPKV